MSRILRHLPEMEDIYFKSNEDKLPEDRKIGYIVITADKGLAGSYNHNILKMAEEHPGRIIRTIHFSYSESWEVIILNSVELRLKNSSTIQFRIRPATVREILRKKFWSYIYISELDEVYIIYTSMDKCGSGGNTDASFCR